MATRQIWFRLGIPALVLLLAGVAAFFPATPASAASASKSCVLSGSNTYICTFTITPAVPLTPGPMLVQMITPGPGTFSGASVVTSSPGCTTSPSISSGSYISPQSGTADYDVVVGAGGCTGAATITVTEMITVTASGLVCQRVWVNAG